jgi:hypothetical protein
MKSSYKKKKNTPLNYSVLVLSDDVTTACFYTYPLFYLATTVYHFLPLQHRASVRQDEWARLLR